MKYSVRYIQKKCQNLRERNPYMQILEKKLKDELNNFCVECGNENPEFISINNGIFICSECAQNHFHFPQNVSKIVNNDIKSLTLNDIQFLLCGGNRALLDFINNEFPKLSEYPPYILYRTQAMVYYRQNLQYLINGGIAPIKPSLKYAYKVSNFINNLQSEFNSMKENISNNFTMSDNETFNTIQEGRKILNNINNFNNFETYANKSNYNFSRGRKINLNQNNNNYNDRPLNTNYNMDNNFDTNYIINKPRQVNFQNNNNIIIGNLNTHNGITEINPGRLMTSQEKINIDIKQKNKRRMKSLMKENNNYLSNVNEVYIKPKPILSPKININCLTINGTLSQRNRSVVTDKNYNKVVEIFKDKNIINDDKNIMKKRLNKNSSQDLYLLTQDGGLGIGPKRSKYFHKSLSQRVIKNEISEKIINKKIIHNYRDKKCTIKTNEKDEILSRIKEIKENKYKIQKNIVHDINDKYKTNNEKFITDKNNCSSQVNNLPIKINLKHNNISNYKEKDKNKEIKLVIKKTQIINEKNYFSSDESKIKDDNSSMNKKNNKEKEKMNNKEKENIIDKKNKTNKTSLCKYLSQTNLAKDSKEKNKKLLGDKVNYKDTSKVSIRNKYKLRRKTNN